MKSHWFAFAGVSAAVWFAGGCSYLPLPTPDPAKTGPFYTPHNFTAERSLPVGLHRVVLLPVHGGELMPRETAEGLDPIFSAALQRQLRFEVVELSRDECEKTFGLPDVSSAASLPHDFLSILGEKYGAQAVMFVDVTTYQAYRPLGIGIRAKLADVATARLIWSYDEIVSTSQPAVANSLRRYYLESDRGKVPFDMSSDALQSPSRFATYAAGVAFGTLPKL
jgi:hypothetical protein